MADLRLTVRKGFLLLHEARCDPRVNRKGMIYKFLFKESLQKVHHQPKCALAHLVVCSEKNSLGFHIKKRLYPQ